MTTALIGKRLKALRDERGIDQDAVAALLGVGSRQIVSNIETGERKVKAEELIALVEGMGVDLDYFTDPFRLEGEGRFSWRRGNEVPADRLDTYERLAGRWIAAFRELAPRVGRDVPLIRPQLPLDKSSSFEAAIAAGERFAAEYELGEVPAARLPTVMEERLGILVLMVDARDGISGAACTLPELGAVLINRKEVKGRRHFDLGHELFHLMTWDKMPPERSESAGGKKNHVEKLADVFASAVLIPRQALQETDWRAFEQGALIASINRRATELGVSADALRWRLASTGLLTQKAAREIPNEVLRHNGYIDLAEPEVPPLFSRRFMQVVVDAIEKGFISARRAARLLDTTFESLSELITEHELPVPDTVR
ncbi:MAG TPA: XRE family transcriptional regulator [Sphingomicrobium sp.]|nr:XRE family transcriptional regulator [Sphingomicrobium sp.]